MTRRRRFATWARQLATVVVLVRIGLSIGFPAGMAVTSLTPRFESAGPKPVGFEALRLVTDDAVAVAVAAWFAPAASGAAIVMLHGAGRGRGSLAAHAGA